MILPFLLLFVMLLGTDQDTILYLTSRYSRVWQKVDVTIRTACTVGLKTLPTVIKLNFFFMSGHEEG